MISFTLRCRNGHRFESWFASGAACDGLLAGGRVTCIDCGTASVEKALMAPSVSTDRAPVVVAAAPEKAADKTDPGSMVSVRALAALRKHVEETADYVGKDFAAEVRAMDAGSVPERPVWGEVTGAEARALIDEGLPVAPLPFGPRAKAN